MLTETGDPVQHHTVCDGALGEQVENRIGQIPVAELLARGEIRRQREMRGAHSSVAIHWPAAAAARPRTTLMMMLAAAGQIRRSSVSRWVSSIHVENVV